MRKIITLLITLAGICASQSSAIADNFCAGCVEIPSNLAGVAVTNMHTFGANEGQPRAGVILGPDGKLYGTTWTFGSAVLGGIVYQIDPSTNLFAPMHVFSPLDANGRNTDGFRPVAPLSVGPDGLLYGTTSEGGLGGPAARPGVGVLFRFDAADPITFHTLHNFGTSPGFSDGATPMGAVASDGHGNYYGATKSGVIYKWDGSSVTTVHVFEPLPPYINVGGGNPYGSPVFGADSKLYGITVYGGTNGRGTVYSLDPVSKEFRVIYNFAQYTFNGNTDNAPLQTLFLASDGALYGTNEFGGPNGTGLVFKVERTVTIVHEFGIYSASAIPRFSNADGALPISTLCEGADGMIYGTTYYGGANGSGTIFRFAKDGTRFESIYSFLPGHDPLGTGSYPATGLIRMPDGSMVGTTFLGGIGHGVVYRLSLTVLTVDKILEHPDHNHLRLFNLKIDGATVRTNINGGRTGPFPVSPGNHTVSETGGTGTPLSAFGRVIGGDCAADGTVNLALGDHKTCTITNYDHAGGCDPGSPGHPGQKCCEPGNGTQGCKLCVRSDCP